MPVKITLVCGGGDRLMPKHSYPKKAKKKKPKK